MKIVKFLLFYISLRLHEYVLHNAMFDFEASHNLMPKAIISLIKDLVVSLDQIPAKNVLMDVFVADIPPQFGMLLSRSWGVKLKGTLQLDSLMLPFPCLAN